MPIINCPDCGHHPVSDRADACPKCGCPIAKTLAGAGQANPALAPVLDQPAMTLGSLEIRVPGLWSAYTTTPGRVRRKISDHKIPSQVKLAPGEKYCLRTMINQSSDLLLLEQLSHVVPLWR